MAILSQTLSATVSDETTAAAERLVVKHVPKHIAALWQQADLSQEERRLALLNINTCLVLAKSIERNAIFENMASAQMSSLHQDPVAAALAKAYWRYCLENNANGLGIEPSEVQSRIKFLIQLLN